MDEKDFAPEEFSLDDIMKEFGSSGEESISFEESADATADRSDVPTEEAPSEVAVSADTAVFPAVQTVEVASEAIISGDTAVFPVIQTTEVAAESPVSDDTAVFPAIQTAEAISDDTAVFPAIQTAEAVSENSVSDDTAVFPAIDQPAVSTEVTGDTVRLDSISEAQATSDDLGDTQRFTPIGEADEDIPTTFPELEAEPEPFSGDWEPQYEQPMGEYIPPQPIIFRPKSRLRELKRKLIAGPEKRYYELTEMGFGKLQAAIFFSLLVVVISAGATVSHGLGLVPQDRTKLMIFWQFFSILFSALLGHVQLMEGVTDIFRKRFSLNSLLAFTFIICCADGVLCLNAQRIPCCAAFSLQVTMSLLNTYHKRTTETAQMDSLRRAVRLDKLCIKENFFEEQNGILRSEGQVEDFMDTYAQPSKPEKITSVYALIALLASLLIGVIAGLLHGIGAGFQAAAVSLIVAAPASFFICLSAPTAILQKRLHKLGTVLCGWQGVEGLCSNAVFPLDGDDLFPAGTTKMNGMKFYGSRDPDEVIAYTNAVISSNGGGLVPLFEQLLDSRNGRHYDVDSLRSYGAGGIGGEVNGEPVLVGELNFMKDMGVEIPEEIRVNQAVYVSIDGDLCGLFAITYNRDRHTAAGLGSLCSYRKLHTVITAGDFMLTESFIRSKFGVRTRRMSFPERSYRAELRQIVPDEDAPALALMTQDGLAPMAYAVTGARSLRSACRFGTWLHLLAGCLGLAIMLTLTLLGAFHLLTPVNVFIYQLVWLLPALITAEWTRTI